MRNPSYPCSCAVCKKEFSSFGIDTHFLRSHGTTDEKLIFSKAAITNQAKKEQSEQTYYQSPTLCKKCNKVLHYPQRSNTYCSSSCAATANNKIRSDTGWSMSAASKEAIRNKLAGRQRASTDKSNPRGVKGPFCKVYLCSCKFCQTKFVSPNKTLACKNCQHLKWNNNKDQYSFRFNIYDYPDLFDLSALKSVGWVAFGGKRGKVKNLTGLSRDHRISVDEAKRCKYDPYYISHPCNCELMPFVKNNKKKTKSSISYDELKKLVDNFDSNRGVG